MFEAFKGNKMNSSSEGLSVKEKGMLFYESNVDKKGQSTLEKINKPTSDLQIKRELSTREIVETIPKLGEEKTMIKQTFFGECRHMLGLFSDKGTRHILQNSMTHSGLMMFEESRPDGTNVTVQSMTGLSKFARVNAGNDTLYDTGELLFNKVSEVGTGIDSEARCRLTLEFALKSKEIASIKELLDGSNSEE